MRPLNWILNCLVVEHDWRLTLLAVGVCVVALSTGVALIDMARGSGGRARTGYAAAAAIVTGIGVWATHCLAMLGYSPGAMVSYATETTLLSLGIVLIGMLLSVAVAVNGVGRMTRPLVSLVAASSVAAMHFVGMGAMRIDGGVIAWNMPMAAGAVFVSMMIALAAATLTTRSGWLRMAVSPILAVVSVVIVHFGGMSALQITPDPTAMGDASLISESNLQVWVVGCATAVVMLASFVTVLGIWGRTTALNHLREAIEAMPDGLGFYDADDRLVIWNARYAEVNPELSRTLVVGCSFREMLELGLHLGLYEDAVGREDEWLAERLLARRQLSNSMEQQIAGNRWLRVQDRRTSNGGIVTVVNDITDLKRDAVSLLEARDAAEAANRAKSEFLANMSHEIRTPLNGVIGLTQALARTPLDTDQREILDLVQSSGHTLQTLLSDILDLARVESGRLEISDEPFDLARAVKDAGQLYAAPATEKGLQFFIEIDPAATVWVRGDVVRLKQVLTNLVSNAVKFTSAGFVSLTACVGADRAGAPIMRFTVEDTGMGFDAGAKTRLFTRFEQADGTITRRFGGTGLGLAICRQLAEMMGGELDCESEPGGGSAFILTLPLVPAEAPAPVARPSPAVERAGGQRLRILVADDHPINRKVVELILSQLPVDLVQAEDGAEALDACRSQTFDLILMDMQMPVMDGLTAVREIRRHEEETGRIPSPIFMVTANALPDHIAAAKAAGADRHMAKPIEASDLLTAIQDLGGSDRRSAAAA